MDTTYRKESMLMNADLLNSKIEQSGLRIGFIADNLGVSLQALSKKRNGSTEFSLKDAKILKSLLNLSSTEFEKIFLD